MTEPAISRLSKVKPRGVRLHLWDHRVVQGNIHLADGQYLAPLLGSRKGWINLVNVEWMATGEKAAHVAFQASKILWASSVMGDIPLMHVPPAAISRPVEVELEGGLVLQAGLSLVPGQRLSDYLSAAGEFIPLRVARLLPRGPVLGDIAVNQTAIQTVQEVERAAEGRRAAEHTP